MEQEEQRTWSIGKIRLKGRIIVIGIKIWLAVFAYVKQSLLCIFNAILFIGRNQLLSLDIR